jgi:hypothetical protein
MQTISYAVELSAWIYVCDVNGRFLWAKPKLPHTRLAGYSPTSVTIEYRPPGGGKRLLSMIRVAGS